MTFSINRKPFEYYFSCHFFAWTKKVTKKSQENPIRIHTSGPEHGGFSGYHTLSRNLLVINQLKNTSMVVCQESCGDKPIIYKK